MRTTTTTRRTTRSSEASSASKKNRKSTHIAQQPEELDRLLKEWDALFKKQRL
jgi:hypothetical protein